MKSWLTFFFMWAAGVLWFKGYALLQMIMSESSLYAFTSTLHVSLAEFSYEGYALSLLILMTFAIAAVMASVMVMLQNSILNTVSHIGPTTKRTSLY
mgnify:CR=1 FL=1